MLLQKDYSIHQTREEKGTENVEPNTVLTKKFLVESTKDFLEEMLIQYTI